MCVLAFARQAKVSKNQNANKYRIDMFISRGLGLRYSNCDRARICACVWVSVSMGFVEIQRAKPSNVGWCCIFISMPNQTKPLFSCMLLLVFAVYSYMYIIYIKMYWPNGSNSTFIWTLVPTCTNAFVVFTMPNRNDSANCTAKR